MAATVLQLYRRISRRPFGHWLFSRLVCFKAPYFGSIAPRLTRLGPNRAEAWIAHRHRVTNHLGTVHAIAMCNLAEFTAGLMTDASIPESMRWIPKGMSVRYLKKAVGPQYAVATPGFDPRADDAGYELPVDVVVSNGEGEAVLHTTITMWVSPRASRGNT